MAARLALLLACLSPLPAGAQVTFADVTAGDLDVPVRSWGVSFADVDADGDPDLFVSRYSPTGGDALYRNDGGAFTAVDAGPLTAGPGSIGHAWADADNDGDLDVLLVGATGNARGFGDTGGGVRLLLNDGTGFAYRALDDLFSPAGGVEGWTGAWADVDGDGRLDVVVAHPAGFVSDPSQPNALVRQVDAVDGRPRFTRVEGGPVTDGLDTYTVPTFSDYDRDGDPDLFIGSGPADGSLDVDHLYRNDGGTFVRITDGAPATDARDGQVMNWQDVDNDGDLDLFVTSFRGGSPAAGLDDLYRNDGDGAFTPVTDDPLTTESTGFSLANTWGDVDLDVFVTTGGAGAIGQDRLYLNDGAGRFTRAWTTAPLPTAGAAFGDTDGDGDLDLVVVSQQGDPAGAAVHPVRLYENRTDNGNAWVKVRLVGTASNAAGVGAMVSVTATIGGRTVTQLREVSTQNTFNGHNDLTVHVGLGDATSIGAVRVEWPSGQVDVGEDLGVDRTLTVTEGQGG